MALYSEPGQMESSPSDFELLGVDHRIYRLKDFSQAHALVVVFMCNHCPYVIAVQSRINELAKELLGKGVRFVAINANDSLKYPEDSFEKMKLRAQEQGYVFPYLWDQTQSVARAYGAVCTPEFYAYAPNGGRWALRYRGRLDDNWKEEKQVQRRDLALALDSILEGREIGFEQKPSMGCSIKWRE